ncbi:MAG: flagellar biosynthesis protein FlhB [Myxococcaceae bacterium]
MSEKTEKPTAKKLKDARKQGQIPRSRILSASVVTFGALAGLCFGSAKGTERLMAWTRDLFVHQSGRPEEALVEGLRVLGWLVGPALAGAFLASIAVSTAQAGFQFNAGIIAPKLERVSPAAGFKKLFSTRQLVDVAKGLVILVVAGLIFWSAVKALANPGFTSIALDGGAGLTSLVAAARSWAWKGLLVVMVMGAGDYALARRRHIKDLMMTREEVKQEHKNSEGDPRAKGQRRAMHKQLAQGGPARGVQKATAIVVNPTHIAVAIRYEPKECEAPYIVAKGREEDAFAIRREAKAVGIPVVKDIPLARSLIHYDVGEEIPEELYRAAAVVLKVASESRI